MVPARRGNPGSQMYLEERFQSVVGAIVAQNHAYHALARGRCRTWYTVDYSHPSRLPCTSEAFPLGFLYIQQPSEWCCLLKAPQYGMSSSPAQGGPWKRLYTLWRIVKWRHTCQGIGIFKSRRHMAKLNRHMANSQIHGHGTKQNGAYIYGGECEDREMITTDK